MAFDVLKGETSREVTYKGVEYKVLDTTGSGLLLVAKKEDIEDESYPLTTFVIPEGQ